MVAHCTPVAFPGSLAHARRVRAHVRTALAGLSAPLVDDVELCASELFANAVEHTATGAPGGSAVLGLRRLPGDRLRLSLTDAGGAAGRPALPLIFGAEWLEADDGRGLLVIASLAIGWGFDPGRGGLTVWADFGHRVSHTDTLARCHLHPRWLT